MTLSIRPGWDHERNNIIGYPYGTLPRLLLFWMTTESVRTGSRRLELGSTLAVQRGGRFQIPFCLATWGLSAILAASFVIGGLEYWYRYIPRSKPPEPAAETAPKKS